MYLKKHRKYSCLKSHGCQFCIPKRPPKDWKCCPVESALKTSANHFAKSFLRWKLHRLCFIILATIWSKVSSFFNKQGMVKVGAARKAYFFEVFWRTFRVPQMKTVIARVFVSIRSTLADFCFGYMKKRSSVNSRLSVTRLSAVARWGGFVLY